MEAEDHELEHSEELNLRLDPGTGNSIVLLGSSKRGKSTAMMYLYRKYYARGKPIVTLFSVSGHADVYGHDKKLIRCSGFNSDGEKLVYLEKFINSEGAKPNKYTFVNMFDDVIDSKHSKLLNELLLTYRNSNMSSIVSLQYPFLLSKMARANVNNILLFGFNSDESIVDVIKMYLRGFFARLGVKGWGPQVALYKEITADHGFIYLHPQSGDVSLHRLENV